jgi:hypothetical protein
MTSFLLLLPLSGRLQRARVRRYRRREPLDEPLGVLPADEHLYRVTQRARWRDAIVDNPELARLALANRGAGARGGRAEVGATSSARATRQADFRANHPRLAFASGYAVRSRPYS